MDAAFYQQLTLQLRTWAQALGFADMGITDTDLTDYIPSQNAWLDAGYAADMHWLGEQRALRQNPQALVPGTLRVISLRMDYLPQNSQHIQLLKSPSRAYVARYALGRDYHKVVRRRIARLGDQLRDYLLAQGVQQSLAYRAFVDSAPISERPLAEKAGLGWIGKNTLLLNAEGGSFFFLGELFTNLPLPVDQRPQPNRCGDCTACLHICPTDAFVAPYVLDAGRCIAYLTIENKGPIPLEFREPMGNRVFGCDDCQAICPWNKFAKASQISDFAPRAALDGGELLSLFEWSESEYLHHTQGMALRRIAYPLWLRNLSIGLGNAPSDPAIIAALEAKKPQVEPWIAEHFDWAIARQKTPGARRLRKIKRAPTP